MSSDKGADRSRTGEQHRTPESGVRTSEREPWFVTPLPVPPWMTKVGVVKVIYHADTGGNDAYESECVYHYTRSGPRFWTAEEAQRWRCPRCVSAVREHELATRDD